MEATFKSEPFPHVLMSNFYSPEECDEVWRELKRLSKMLLPPEQVGPAFSIDTDGQKVLKKNNLSVFLSLVYKSRLASPIWSLTRKFFDKEFMARCFDLNFFFAYLPQTNYDDVLVQFYGDGQYYQPHKDRTTFSVITNFSSDPREYSGGVLRFTEFDYAVDLKRNESILFPSFVEHEVTPVSLQVDDVMKHRITITTFIGLNNL